MNKEDYAYAMATLLCLDHNMQSDLMKLSEKTLAKMYVMYIQNAKDASAKVENAYKHVLASSRRKNTGKDPEFLGLR